MQQPVATATGGAEAEEVAGVEFVNRGGRVVSGSSVVDAIQQAVANEVREHVADQSEVANATHQKFRDQASTIAMLKKAYDGSNALLKKQVRLCVFISVYFFSF